MNGDPLKPRAFERCACGHPRYQHRQGEHECHAGHDDTCGIRNGSTRCAVVHTVCTCRKFSEPRTAA